MTAAHGWYAFTILFIVLQILASFLRYGVRFFLVKRMGYDDLAHFITLVISVVYCGLLVPIFTNPNLDNVRHMPMSVIKYDTKLAYAGQMLYILGTMFLKISAGSLLLRIFIVRWQVMTLYCVMGITIIYNIFAFFFTLFECGNPKDFFGKFRYNQCLSYDSVSGVQYAMSVLSIVGDIIFCVLPMVYLWSAKLDRTTKLSVGGILCLASAGCIVTIARLPQIHFQTTPSQEYLYAQGWCVIFSAAELSIGVTCLALATYRPLLKVLRGSSSDRNQAAPIPLHGEVTQSGGSYDQYDLEAVDSSRESKEKMMTVKSAGTVQYETRDNDS